MRKSSKTYTRKHVQPKGGEVGQKLPLTPQQVEMLATFLCNSNKLHAKRDFALFRFAIDSMLRAVDVLAITAGDIIYGGQIKESVRVVQQKTGTIAVCYLTGKTIEALRAYLESVVFKGVDPMLWGDDTHSCRRIFDLSHSRYHAIVKGWCSLLHVDPKLYGTHSLRRTKATAIYDGTGNVEAIRQLLGHTTIAHTQAYLGVDKTKVEAVARNTLL